MNRNIDWHSKSGNNIHQLNQATVPQPGFLTSQVWMSDLENDIRVQGNGVEIIELNSADNSQSSNDDSRDNARNKSHPWSYAAKIKDLEDQYKANRQARLKRRLRNRNHFFENEFDDSFYFNNTECATPDTADVDTFKKTCFTILEKLSTLKLDSSSDDFEYSGDEAMGYDMAREPRWDDEAGNEEVMISSGVDGAKRTVWMYSFQDRGVLSDHDFQLVNMPSRESLTFSDELNTNKSTRVSSPIPPTHIPRLNLSLGATLPNVTEVTEPIPNESSNGNRVPITQKLANNWCLDNSKLATENKATSVVNWMALSPRERRRHSRRNSSYVPLPLLPVTEVLQDEEKPQNPEPIGIEVKEPAISKEVTPDREHFDMEIINKSTPSRTPSQMNSQRSSIRSRRENVGDNATYLISPIHKSGTETELTKLKTAVRTALCDRGDCKFQRPRVTVNKSPLRSANTIPIENLASNDWIGVEQSWRGDERRAVSAGARLMLRNLSLLKPAEWQAYSPITRSPLSIHIEPERQTKRSLLRRCISCFQCCKYRSH